MSGSDVTGEKRKVVDEGWIGPSPSEAAPIKKVKTLKYESLFLSDLPSEESYERSFMHRDSLSFTTVSKTDFVITASVDGHIKFWKKHIYSIEFVKHFRAHLGTITGISLDESGAHLATVSDDKHAKVFDVLNFDMINMIQLNYIPSFVCWVYKPGDPVWLLILAEKASSTIRVYDGKDPSCTPLRSIERLHSKPVCCLGYNSSYDLVLSADESGVIEYWNKEDFSFPTALDFDSKLDTDLYECAKKSTIPLNINVSPDGKIFATFGADRVIRIFKFKSGKMILAIDESIKHYIELQHSVKIMPSMEFNKKISVEKDIEKVGLLRLNSILFDKSSNFILYSSIQGIKIVNLVSGKCVKILGKQENIRFLNLSLFQGVAKKVTEAAPTIESICSDNPALDSEIPDPTVFATAHKKNRFYLLTRRSGNGSDRDVFNEKPSKEDIISASEEKGVPKLYSTATIHTSVGDLHINLFPSETPKTIENFCTHAKSGYYNGHIFHRVIKQFMIQTGDPTGVGTGGESIWGGEFEDEFHPKLKHDRPFTLSMANAGPNTNGSQFFISVVPAPWLDNKHTVFGRVSRGMEVAQTISNVKTHPKTDQPYDDITIVSISVRDPVHL